jgi:hypothetical protein
MHWNRAYICNRLSEIAYQRMKPDLPWLTRDATSALGSLLNHTDVGLEFGSGRSTVWFARRLALLTSVEHSPLWHAKVSQMIQDQKITNIDYRLRTAVGFEDPVSSDNYLDVLAEFADASLDFVLVDGVQRAHCAKAAIPKVRSGGLLVVDNANWFLPSDSDSPSSRTIAQGPRGPEWREVHERLSDWRRLWTTNGVSDTTIFFKP